MSWSAHAWDMSRLSQLHEHCGHRTNTAQLHRPLCYIDASLLYCISNEDGGHPAAALGVCRNIALVDTISAMLPWWRD